MPLAGVPVSPGTKQLFGKENKTTAHWRLCGYVVSLWAQKETHAIECTTPAQPISSPPSGLRHATTPRL